MFRVRCCVLIALVSLEEEGDKEQTVPLDAPPTRYPQISGVQDAQVNAAKRSEPIQLEKLSSTIQTGDRV